jgi:hypothetical protein
MGPQGIQSMKFYILHFFSVLTLLLLSLVPYVLLSTLTQTSHLCSSLHAGGKAFLAAVHVGGVRLCL